MSTSLADTTPRLRAEVEPGRILAHIDQGHPGPTFLAQAAIHGNEPAGIEALRRITTWLEQRQCTIHGRFVGCVGNLRALAQGDRYLKRDLNRQWLPESVERLTSQDESRDSAEDHEQRALLALYDELDATRGDHAFVFVDLHTSSAPGAPFTCMADTVPNRRIADAIPVPMILGLEECIDGAVMEWFNQRQQIGIAVEGGRHQDEAAIDNLEAATWLAMVAAGVIREAEAPPIESLSQRLVEAAGDAPHLLEILHRQAITVEDGFVMTPGYTSFQQVSRNELLAHDARGEVRAAFRGRILLPLYQPIGEDGFFLGRRIPRFWFELSAVLRNLPVERLLAWLPGIHHDRADPDTLLADTRVARYLVVQVFHLFGFRRRRPRGPKLLSFTRRRAAPETWHVQPLPPA